MEFEVKIISLKNASLYIIMIEVCIENVKFKSPLKNGK